MSDSGGGPGRCQRIIRAGHAITEEEVRTASGIQSADEVNVLEETIQQGIESLTFKPYEVKFLRLMFR